MAVCNHSYEIARGQAFRILGGLALSLYEQIDEMMIPYLALRVFQTDRSFHLDQGWRALIAHVFCNSCFRIFFQSCTASAQSFRRSFHSAVHPFATQISTLSILPFYSNQCRTRRQYVSCASLKLWLQMFPSGPGRWGKKFMDPAECRGFLTRELFGTGPHRILFYYVTCDFQFCLLTISSSGRTFSLICIIEYRSEEDLITNIFLCLAEHE